MNNIQGTIELASLLAEVVGATMKIENGIIFYNVRKRKKLEFTMDYEELDKIFVSIGLLEVKGETELFNDYSYEVLVREEGMYPFRRLRDDKIVVNNEVEGVSYDLSEASDEYFVWFVVQIVRKYSLRFFRHPVRNQYYEDKYKDSNIITYIKRMMARVLTLKIYSEYKINVNEFAERSYSFLFVMGFNSDVALIPQRLLEEVVRRGRITGMRRSRLEHIEPPRKKYNKELVQRYLLALSTDNPVIEFLSYYQVAEYFFERVFNDDLVDNIKKQITDPGFSYKRKQDIMKLITKIKKSLQIRSETITFSENLALELCLQRYIVIGDLRDKINDYDNSLIEYYKNNAVEFSDGPKVDLESRDEDKVFSDLAKRIYKTRNSLVHSKDSDKLRYTPFRDDRTLVKEVPLLRFISETIIVEDAGVL